MKVLIVNTSDIKGGAARAAYRLHHALLAEGIDSQMLVQDKSSDDYTVIGPKSKFDKVLVKLRPAIDGIPVRSYSQRSKTLFSPSWLPFSSVVERINEINPDIVHLHWIAGGMMRVEEIAKIKAPIVWSLHDMWPFTGGCHYDEYCGGYKNNCGRCKVLGSSKNSDLSSKVHKRKTKAYQKISNLAIVGLSHWLAKEARASSLFKGLPIYNLPNPVETNIFAPFEKSTARKLLNLPQNTRLVLFGAMNAFSDARKGYRELTEAVTTLDVKDTELVVFGASKPKDDQTFNQRVHYLGKLHDDISLRALYSAADVMVVPSIQENLSNAILESLSCGTPVVAFDTGGNGDMIEHKKNGYLAEPFDPSGLAEGIDWVLQHPEHARLSMLARQKVEDEFDSHIVADQYIDLYKNLINRSCQGSCPLVS